MNSMFRTSNNRGQALVESLFSLPLVVGGATLILGGLHSLFVFYLVDYWTYKASFCLAKERPVPFCEQEIKSQLLRTPLLQINSVNMRLYHDEAYVKTSYATPFSSAASSISRLALPIKANDFRGSQ